jgi:peptidoglycan/xylan/chitin deacetylase (PgdA/CDA1 family)
MLKSGILHMVLMALALWTAIATGCTGRFLAPSSPPADIRTEHLAVVTVAEQDTLESLARSHLGDAGEAWRIAQYNQVQRAQMGQRLVIPLQPVAPGGLRPDGYQVVPILFYPRIGPEKGSPRGVPVRIFEAQLQFLRENGYETVSLAHLTAFLSLSAPLPPKAILITFDSAEPWVFEIAYPILKRNGFSAALFVPTGQIGTPRRLDWKTIAAMAAEGFDIGTSGVSARPLKRSAKQNPEDYLGRVEEEITLSQKAIARNLNMAATFFAYPGGLTSDLVIALLKKHGFSGALTQTSGENPFFADNFKLRRTIVSAQDPEAYFRQSLTTFHTVDLQ